MQKMPRWLKRIELKELDFYVVGLLAFVAMPMVSGWAADFVVQWWVNGAEGSEWWLRWMILLGAGVVVLSYGLYKIKRFTRRFVSPNVRTIVGEVKRRQVVIAFLSRLNVEIHQIRRQDPANPVSPWIIGGSEVVSSLEQWARSEKNLTNWQPLARAFYYHQQNGGLKHVMLLTSKDGPGVNDSGSHSQIGLAIELFSDLLNRDARSIVTVNRGEYCPVDFENLEEIVGALKRTLSHVNDNLKIEDEQIVLDVTGGQKTTSIAGALVTLDRPGLMFQYMPLGRGSEAKPKAYEASTSASNLN